MLEQERHQFAILLQQASEVAVERGIRPLEAIFEVEADGIESGEAARATRLGTDQRRSQAGLAERRDGPLGRA